MKLKYFLCSVLTDCEFINNLDDSTAINNTSFLVFSIIDKLNDFIRILKNTNNILTSLVFEITDRELFLDVLKTESDVLIDGPIGPESIVLEKETDITLISRNVDTCLGIKDNLITDFDLSGSRCFKTRNPTKDGCLTASGRS